MAVQTHCAEAENRARTRSSKFEGDGPSQRLSRPVLFLQLQRTAILRSAFRYNTCLVVSSSPSCAHPCSTPLPPHNRQHDHPVPHRSPRRIQSIQPSLEARALIPLAHTRRCTRWWHDRPVEAAAPNKRGQCDIRRQVQYVLALERMLSRACQWLPSHCKALLLR